jgi:hypothetical protein
MMEYQDIDDIIRTAIASKNMIEFTYQGRQRIAEPHVYGVHNGKRQVLVYQVGGDSVSGALPGWHRIDVDKISSIRITPKTFIGNRRLISGKHSNFDEILAIASIRDAIAE